jgi:hypothetical protein
MHNIEAAFHKAIRAHWVQDPADTCEITPLICEVIRDQDEHKMLLITISSFVFRLIVIFGVTEDSATRAYYLHLDAAQPLDEVLGEVANMCGGALNRTLAANFSHLAMSTPCTLSGQCMPFLDKLRAQSVSRYAITINGSVRIQAALCMCCLEPIEVADEPETEQGEPCAGELELF